MTTDETAATETLEALAKSREKTAAGVNPAYASPGAQFEARRLEEEADYFRMGAAAIRARGMLVGALERIAKLTAHGPTHRRAEAFRLLNQIAGAAQSALAGARKP